MDDYAVKGLIGRGSYGSVVRATHVETGKDYAIKQLNVTRASHYEQMSILNELRILASHTCPHMIRFKTCFVDDQGLLSIVTEFAGLGDLARILRRCATTRAPLTEASVWTYLLQLCVAVGYLHGLNVIHRDLKPANVFVDAENNVKLGDLGIVKVMKPMMKFGQTQIGSPLYMSPERFRNERYDTKIDMWSIGCILHEMMHLCPPFAGYNLHDLRVNIFRAKVATNAAASARYGDDLQGLRRILLSPNHARRPSVKTLFSLSCVQTQMRARHIDPCAGAGAGEFKSAFYTKHLVPRRLEDWREIAGAFRDLNSTVQLSASDRVRVDRMQEAKRAIERHGIVTPDRAVLSQLDAEIAAAKNELNRLRDAFSVQERVLRDLQDKRAAVAQATPPTPSSRIPRPPSAAPSRPRPPWRMPR